MMGIEMIACTLYMCPVFELERDVVHFLILGLEEIHGVVIRTAAQENKEIFDPIRHTKA